MVKNSRSSRDQREYNEKNIGWECLLLAKSK